MSNLNWATAPIDATHGGNSPYERGVVTWFKDVGHGNHSFLNDGSMQSWHKGSGNLREWILVERPKPWSGPEDGLPPVGLEIEVKIDFKKAPPYAIITLTELGVDVQKHTPRFQKAKVLYASSKYLVTESCGAECLTPMSCVEIRAIRTAEQRAADKRETAIREIMDVADVDCRVTAARLVDAGFKREVV